MGRKAEKTRQEARKTKRKEDLASQTSALDSHSPAHEEVATETGPPVDQPGPGVPTDADAAVPVDKTSRTQQKKKEVAPTLAATRSRRFQAASPPVSNAQAETVNDTQPKQQNNETHKESLKISNGEDTRPVRKSSEAIRTLIGHIALSHIAEQTDDDDWGSEHGDGDGVSENDAEGDMAGSGGNLVATKKTVEETAEARKTKDKMIESDSGSETEDEEFQFTVEVNNRENRSRVNEIMSSLITWYTFEDKISRALNVHPSSVHIQYRFSTDGKDSLLCDLTCSRHLATMITLLRPLVVPMITKSGRPSARKMKPVTVQVFNRNDEPQSTREKGHSKASKKEKTKDFDDEEEKEKTEGDIFHEKKVAARKAIIKAFTCPVHSLPDKATLCFTSPDNGLCYPIAENHLNLWATWCIKDPEKFSPEVKPGELNLYAHGPRARTAAIGRGDQSANFAQYPPGMPFSHYPLPYGLPPWYGPPQHPNPTPAPAPAAPSRVTNINYPKINDWLMHCDRHSTRSGENFSAYARKFDAEGFRRIDQLTGSRISVENLSKWLDIGKGTADLIIQYASEDVALLKAGEFKMDSGNFEMMGFE